VASQLPPGVPPLDPLPPDPGGERWAEPAPPEPHRFVADLDAALVQQVFHVPQGEREPDMEHHRQTDDLGAGLEVSERAARAHQASLGTRPAPLKPISSDRTLA